MSGAGESRTGAVTAALAQTAAAVGAHAAANGCLPTARSLAVAVPLAVVGVLALGRLLDARPLLRLAGGQLAGHLALTVAAACTGHAHGLDPHVAMTVGHVAALVACRALLDRTVEGVEHALARTVLPPARPPLVLPAALRPCLPVPAPLRGRTCLRVAPVRGPPAALAR